MFSELRGDNALLLVPHKPSVEQFFQKIVFRQISQISTFSPFGQNLCIWELQHVLFLAQQTNTLIFVPHMPTLKQSFKISNFRKIKKGRGQYQKNLILAYYAQIWKFGPGPPKIEFFKIFSILWKGIQISLPTSPQPPQALSLSQVMLENVILAYYAQIWKFGPRLPKMEFFKKIHFLKSSPDFASNEPSATPRN